MMRLMAAILVLLFRVCMSHAGLLETPPKVKYPGQKSYTFRFAFKDKKGCGYSTEKPWQFLSRKAIERRRRQGLQVDSTDLPVSRDYIRPFLYEEVLIVGKSKWNNTILVNCSDTTVVERLRRLPFVVSCCRVWESPDSIIPMLKRRRLRDEFNSWDSVKTSRYGSSAEQISVLNGIKLHDNGYRGKGMTIAVLDGGFKNVDRCPAFKNVRIEGYHDFVYPNSFDIFNETDHGTKVLSAMAINAPDVYIGTAPEASYWLLRCEDQQSEQPVEEDYWAMAAEFADSAGVDVINSSLGYNEYDNHHGDHKYHEMDGQTALISRTASMLAAKGIILVNSAGNSGMGPWKKLTFPADADDILTVGAITSTLANAPFSGVGPTQDGRVKPDVMAIGSPTTLVSARGTVMEDMGTSFAAPLICGLVACLWQSMPYKTAVEIIELVRRSGDNARHPDNVFGYGVPDFIKAWIDGLASSELRVTQQENNEIIATE